MEEQENVISLDISKVITKTLQLSVFIALAVAAPYFLNQLITGSIVNALLFISASVLSLESAFFLCLVPSLISLYTGLLPLTLAPMIPFIMTGNALMVLIFSLRLRSGQAKRNFWFGAIPAAFVKYIFILSVGIILANSILKGTAKGVLLMISWPQLATAIAGACIAYLLLRIARKI
jgi:hypothetical protein